MIALRGVVYKDDEARWKWSGVWTFGTLPPHAGRDLESLTAKIPNVRPVQYVFVNPFAASTVEIPSLAMQSEIDEDGEEAAKDESAQEIQTDKAGLVIEENVAETKSMNSADANSHLTEDADVDSKNPAETDAKGLSDIEKLGKQDSAVTSDDMRERQQDETCETDAVDVSAVSNELNKGDDETSTKLTTFSAMLPGDPAYTEASTVFDCPPDGGWDGYFENIIRGRKADNRVAESVSLFWNATPPNDARSVFLDQDSDAGRLEPGRVHVRGMGTNQFGVFELLGSFDTATKVLELQRMYVSTSEPLAPKPSSSPKVTPSRKSTTHRAYSTRKRKLSWQRRSTLSDDEDEIVGMQRHIVPSKKKARVSLTSAEKTALPAAMNEPQPPALFLSAAGSGTKKPSPVASSELVAAPKKRGSQSNRTVFGSSSPLSSPHDVTLPPVGDPDEARWRAAHFLYYQRNDPTTDDSTTTTSYIVYEGEMLHGKSMRHGRGVCLYNNGTLYEGEWKRNREHGVGTLMTADRRRIVYTGEWERGRMHGQGIYYFRPNESGMFPATSHATSTASTVVPRYEGEFKENCRHGNGKYFLPDGSTYEGEWRENLMSGRGAFVWPDGSAYIGQWKDGKRHGQGLLQAADNFTYDGMWVKNAMEGRGTAQYPGGQRYEGLWANGRREGRGTIQFVNGAVYEGRFRDDAIEGQGTMKMTKAAKVPIDQDGELKEGWMIPISFQSDMGRIHQKAGFTVGGG
ncbi:translation initiation factor IF-2 [Fragilaria crotonensis]|nr:translation initiation factor IF-2 [Fragilaria crotonensis]